MGIQIMANGNWLLKRRNWYMEIGYRKSVNRKRVNKKRVIRKMEIGYRKKGNLENGNRLLRIYIMEISKCKRVNWKMKQRKLVNKQVVGSW